MKEIAALRPRVERAIERLGTRLDVLDKLVDELNLYGSADYWRLVAFKDGMIKVRLILEQSFHFIETLGILATSRYIFELLIWLRLLSSGDPGHCFDYVKQLITDKRDHAEEHLAQVKREIKLFRELEERESRNSAEAARFAGSPSDLRKLIDMLAAETDRIARRHFCLYGADAKINGYGYQAFLMEKPQGRCQQSRRALALPAREWLQLRRGQDLLRQERQRHQGAVPGARVT